MANETYEALLAEEEAIAHLQAMIIRLLDEKGITRADLADRMRVSAAHVSQLLADEPQNLSVRKAARVFHALGEELILTCNAIEELNRKAVEKRGLLAALLRRPKSPEWHQCANSNDGVCDAERELAAA